MAEQVVLEFLCDAWLFLAQDVFAHVPLLAEDLARLRASKRTAN